MPLFDRTGPFGKGQMTGRGFGPCSRGWAWRRMSGQNAPCAKRDLEEYKKSLQEELIEVEKELANFT